LETFLHVGGIDKFELLSTYEVPFKFKLNNLGEDLEDRLCIPNHPESPIWLPYYSPPTSTILLDVLSPSIIDLNELQATKFAKGLSIFPSQLVFEIL